MTVLTIYSEAPEHRGHLYKPALEPKFPELEIRFTDKMEDAIAMIPDTEILVGYGPRFHQDLFDAGTNLKWVHSLITGLDWLYKFPDIRDDIIITSTNGIHGPPVAEMALMHMLALTRGLPQFFRQQPEAKWNRIAGGLLDGKTVGVLGVGVITECLAPMLQAMNMRVLGFSSAADREVEGIDAMYHRDDMAKIAPELDFLVAVTPYTPETDKIIGKAVFDAMKPSAFLVNVARGGVVDEDALVEALRNNQLAGAGLDTFRVEPLPADNPLWSLENVIITPHNAGLSEAYVRLALPVVEENIRRYFAGDQANMLNIVSRGEIRVA
ncbi:MAG: D-2-hydroxyacid dehydrogenase [Proteobacteria bacterium]|nr:D-2-hydroxyacid dehydrogenase [Pseudomonadota bacterium]